MTVHRNPYEELLPLVEKPSRYLGTEYNSVHRDAEEVDLRAALVFPDLYDLGLGNLGLLILYAILNDRPWCWCERAYAPAPDMEALLRERGLPLFANESKDPLHEMDLLGFTMQSELTYTNILNILDLGGVPLRSEDRGEEHPLVCAGGPTVFNPEPLAPFMDFMVIGDGEEVIVEVAEVLRSMRGSPRREKLEALARLEGIYVPSLYPVDVLDDGRILPSEDGPVIRKRILQDLDGARYPTNYIVPFTQQVHDRVGLEVLRGCTHGCRFCQAGMVTRPVRERNLDNIDELMERTLDQTGYEEVSLVSLSTCDYSESKSLVHQAAVRARERNVSVSLPSLRLDSFAVELADMVAGVRRSGLTFAPEAASPRLRAVINKYIPDEELLNMAAQAFQRGWTHVKTYFMIGLPTEEDEDVEAIAELCLRTLKQGRAINPKARVNTGVSTFVPKPFTPFQWAEQITPEEAERRQGILKRAFHNQSGVKFGRHTPESTFIEGLLSRTDRRAADLVEAAWRNGARFESNDQWLDIDAWRKAIEQTGFDVYDALRERGLDERLPWDHLDVLVDKDWLRDDWNKALERRHAVDCRQKKCHKCGVMTKDHPLCKPALRRSHHGRKKEAGWRRPEAAEYVEPEPQQRLRFRIGRDGEARFLSHLEQMNAWVRAFRRAKAPLSYSQGFHTHPKLNFATAPPVGEETEADYVDIVLKERVDPAGLLERLQQTLPIGFHAYAVEEVPMKAPALMSALTGFEYDIVVVTNDADSLRGRVEEVLAAEELFAERRAKAGKKKGKRRASPGTKAVNVRPNILSLEVIAAEDGAARLHLKTQTVESRGVKVREVLQLLGVDPAAARVRKTATHLAEEASPAPA